MTEIDEKGPGPTKAIPSRPFEGCPYITNPSRECRQNWVQYISSNQIGGDLKSLPIQVRKDLQVTEAAGKPKLGYDVAELIRTIETFLGWNNTTDGDR